MTATDREAPPEDVRPGYSRRWWVLATMTVCLLVVIMGNTILNVALPTLQRELQATQGQLIRMEAALKDLPKPMFGYCRSGARAGSLYSSAKRAMG